MKNPREASKSVNPKNLAVWTLGALYEKLCEYAHEVYNDIEHPALGMTPEQAFVTRVKQTGERDQAGIPYDEDFRMMTMPTTDKGTAKVLPGLGVKINNIFYNSDEFLNPDVENKQALVRFDPYNAGIAYALVRRRWARCISDHYATFEGRSEKEMLMATTELRRRHRLHSRGYFTVTAKKLADFLNSVEAEECLLLQRARDRESRSIIERINSGFTSVGGSSLPERVRSQTEMGSGAGSESAPITSSEVTPERRATRARSVIEEF
ncbi:MAG TPA: hypothetical protein VIQ24_23110 [Pyrinomonadaceae bacterium]